MFEHKFSVGNQPNCKNDDLKIFSMGGTVRDFEEYYFQVVGGSEAIVRVANTALRCPNYGPGALHGLGE